MSGKKQWTWDQIEQARKPVTASARICVRNDLIAEKEQLEQQLYAAREDDRRNKDSLDRKPEAPQIAQKIVDLEDKIDDAQVEFVFRELGQRKWNELLKQHPPTKQQKAEGARAFNPDTFPIAALTASCVKPAGSTEEHFQKVFDEWGGQFGLLWEACLDANVRVHEGKGRSLLASEVLANIGTGSEQRHESESL